MLAAAGINDFTDQVRHRIGVREANFSQGIKALESSQAARGLLRSGSTIKKALDALAKDFDAETSEVLAYLGGAAQRTALEPQEMFQVVSQLLLQSAISFKAAVRRERLEGFAPSKGIGAVIDKAFDDLDRTLALRLREFAVGLHASSPSSSAVPASDRYVSIADNQQADLKESLEALADAVRGSNEATEVEREIAKSEIAAFEATIVQPRVSLELIERFVRTVLKWIVTVFTAAGVQEVAQRLIQALMILL
jgi:hypothetical protein